MKKGIKVTCVCASILFSLTSFSFADSVHFVPTNGVLDNIGKNIVDIFNKDDNSKIDIRTISSVKSSKDVINFKVVSPEVAKDTKINNGIDYSKINTIETNNKDVVLSGLVGNDGDLVSNLKAKRLSDDQLIKKYKDDNGGDNYSYMDMAKALGFDPLDRAHFNKQKRPSKGDISVDTMLFNKDSKKDFPIKINDNKFNIYVDNISIVNDTVILNYSIHNDSDKYIALPYYFMGYVSGSTSPSYMGEDFLLFEKHDPNVIAPHTTYSNTAYADISRYIKSDPIYITVSNISDGTYIARFIY